MRISMTPAGCAGRHLRGHDNILKRLLVHTCGFNLGLLMRALVGVGTPRGLQGRLAAVMAVFVAFWTLAHALWRHRETPSADTPASVVPSHRFEPWPIAALETPF